MTLTLTLTYFLAYYDADLMLNPYTLDVTIPSSILSLNINAWSLSTWPPHHLILGFLQCCLE